MAKQFKDPFASIRATQEKELKKLQGKRRDQPVKTASSLDFKDNIYQQKGVSTAAPLKPSAVATKKAELAQTNPVVLYSPEMARYASAPQSAKTASPVKRLPAAGGIGLLEGIMNLGDKINTLNYLPQAPLSVKKSFKASKPAGTYSKQVNTLPYDDATLEGLKKGAGLQGTLAENILYNIGKETPAIVASYGTVGAATKIPAIGKALMGAGKWTETGRRGVAAGALYTPIANENPEAKDYLENMALFGLGDVAFMGAAHGLGKGVDLLKGIPKRKVNALMPEESSETVLDDLLGNGPSNATKPEAIDGEYSMTFNRKPLALQEGVTPEPQSNIPNWEYWKPPRMQADEQLALPSSSGERLSLPEGVNWERGTGFPKDDYWFVDQYGVTRNEPGTPLALAEGRTGQGSRFIRQDEGAVPRSDIGDPEYLAGLEKQYSDMINAEVANMKSELGGVESIPGRNIRVSANPAWYREFWQKHLRAPREGEYRDMAIRNLMEGNPETGEPANNEFLGILSELSRGQKLPEEWHGLQKSIRQLEGDTGESAIKEPVVMDEETYLAVNGASNMGFGDSGMHKGGMSHGKAWEDALKRQSLKDDELLAKRAQLQQEYRDKVQAGELRPPTVMEQRIFAANGHPDNESTQAARRMLAKKGIDWQSAKVADNAVNEQNETRALLSDMQTAQKQVEPYGLTRDLSRLSEVENQARAGMADRADFGKYEGVRFKREIPEGNNENKIGTPEEVEKNIALGRDAMKNVIETKTDALNAMHRPDLGNVSFYWGNSKGGVRHIIEKRSTEGYDGEKIALNMVDVIARGKRGEIYGPEGGRRVNISDNGHTAVLSLYKAGNKETWLLTGWKDDKAPDVSSKGYGLQETTQSGPMRTRSGEGAGASTENIPPEGLKGNGGLKLTKFKRDLSLTPEQQQDLAVLEEMAAQRKVGPFTINKVELAPEAMGKPEFKAAGDIAEKLGLRLVTYKGKGARGAQSGRTLYINEGITDPVDYVFWHEVGHSMENTHSEHYGQLMKVAVEHISDAKGLEKHYEKFGYAAEDMPHELAADVFAEALSTPGFFGKVAEKAPELIKPLLEAIDNLIARVKSMVSKNDTVMPYLKNLEDLRARVRDEVATPYFQNAMGEKQFVDTFGKQWQEPAAKAKGEVSTRAAGVTDTREFRQWFGDSKVVDEQGKPLVVYHGTGADFNAFDKGKIGSNYGADKEGFFFTSNPKEAEWAANDAVNNLGGAEQIYPTYLNIEKPFEINGVSMSSSFVDNNKEALLREARAGGFDGIIVTDKNGQKTYIAFEPEQIKSVYNRGTWDTTNPDIRFKLGSSGNSPIDDFKAMVQYGAKQLHKGNFEHFGKLMQKQFPDVFEGYSPEAARKVLSNVWARAKELRDNGETSVTFQGQKIPIRQEKMSSAGKGFKAAEQRIASEPETSDIDTGRHIVSKAQRDPIIAKESAKMVYTKAVDDLYRLDELDKFVAKTTGKHLPAEDKAYLLAINSRESTGAARAILEENLVDSKGNIVGPSFKEVLSNIPRGKEQDFRDYLVLRNSISWMEQDKQVYPRKWAMTPEKAKQRLAAYDKQTPELKQAADEYVKWHRDMAKSWLVDTGIITPDAWQAFLKAHPYYTPFQRQMKPIETTPGQGKAKRGFANQTNPTKKAEGSERPIVDPIESTIEQVDRYVKTAKRNEVMQAVIRNLEKAPDELSGFAEIIPEKGMDALDNINTVLKKDGIDGVINYLEEPFEQMTARKLASKQPLDKPNIVRAFADGERVHVKVNDPVLLDALTTLSDTGVNALVESFRTATRLMKVLTTGGNPIFATRNIARDIPMAYVSSETLSKAPGVREAQFTWDMLDSLARIVTNERWHPDKFYQEYKAMGGGSHTASVAADRNLLAESKSKVMPGYWRPENNTPLSYVGKGAKAGFQGIERFTSTVEALPRLPEYIRTVKKGGNNYASKLEGLHASQDVTVNFSRRGEAGKDVDAFIPYFNAAVQGIEKIARMFGKDPLGATYRSIVAVTVPTIGLYLFNKDNPNYHKLSGFVRDNYYCIPYQDGKKFIKVAKPREIGVVFSDLPERALRQWEADDPEGFYQFSEAWVNNFVPPVRPIVMPAADVMRNKDFAGRPIVPGYMEDLSPELQYDEKTSAAAKTIGDALKLSPKKLDYLFRSYSGVIGELGIPAMAQGRGQNIGQRVGEVLTRTFTADPLYSNDVMNKFYEQKEKLDTAASDYGATGNKGKQYDPSEQRYYNRQARRISNIRKEIRNVNADSSLSYAEKEKRTRRMQANMLEIAQKAVGERFSPRANMAR